VSGSEQDKVMGLEFIKDVCLWISLAELGRLAERLK